MLGYGIGVDLGGTNLRVGAVDENGRMLDKVCTAIAPLTGRDQVVGRMCADIARFREHFRTTHRLLGIGISIPGIVDLAAGILRESPNLPGWSDYPVRDEVERRLGTAIILENDANAAAMGEFWIGAARGHSNIFMITLGTGVGGAIILNGTICHGMSGMAGEPGHMTVFPDGPRCLCGNRGCLEEYSGARSIVRSAKAAAEAGRAPALAEAIAANPEFTARDLYEIAVRGDSTAREIFEASGRALGIAIAGIINLLNPSACIVGGGGSGAWDLFSPVLLEEVQQRSFVYRATTDPDATAATRIYRATLGADGGIYGAARLPMLAGEQSVSALPAM